MRPTGPIPAGIAIVGEAPGAEEERVGAPFVGASGRLLDRLLMNVGLARSNCFVTNVCRVRPPGNDISLWISDNKRQPHPDWQLRDGLWHHPHIAAGLVELERELAAVQPKVIIALGGIALWALTGRTGIGKWRGSRIALDRWTVVPALPPDAILYQLEWYAILQMDLARAKAIYEGTQKPRSYSFLLAPSYPEALDVLRRLQHHRGPLSVDIETRAGAIACIGFAWSETHAVCIPILQAKSQPFFWPLDQETNLRWLMHRLFFRPEIEFIGQNFLYDCQYFSREGMGYPRRVFDTMIGHHALFSLLRKGLDFLSSMYAQDHIYWKDESKNWDPALGERQLWEYNCKDACITYEVAAGIRAQLRKEVAR